MRFRDSSTALSLEKERVLSGTAKLCLQVYGDIDNNPPKASSIPGSKNGKKLGTIYMVGKPLSTAID